MTARHPRRPSARIYPRIAPELAERLAKYAAAAGISETSVVETALREHLDRTSDTTLLMARIDRLARALDRFGRDQQLHAEAFAAFVKIWLAQTPQLPVEERKNALALAEARFGQLLNHIAQQLARGRGFFDLLPREPVADEQDLAKLSEGVATDNAGKADAR